MNYFKSIIICILISFILSVPVLSAEYIYQTEEIGKNAVDVGWDRLTDSLPENIRNELSDISLSDPIKSAEVVKKITGIPYWLEIIADCLTGSVTKAVSMIFPVISMLILTASVQLITPLQASQGLQKAFITCIGLISAVMLYNNTYTIISICTAYLNKLCTIMNLMTPIMEAVYLSCGAFTQMAVSTQSLTLSVTLAGNFTGKLLGPMSNLLFTLSAVSSVCSEAKISQLTTVLRKFIMRLIGIFSLFFSFMLGSQSVLAKSADSLTLRTARFALGSFIPIAGGTIAEALSTVREGMTLIKSTAGIGGIIIILLLLLPELISLTIFKLTLSAVGSAAEILKTDNFASLLREICGIVELLIAVMLFTSLMFVIMLILFVKAQVSS